MGKGYKCFDENLQCRKFQYEIGNVYKHDGEIALCESGFHFCLNAADVFNYYDFDVNNIVCIVEFDESNVVHGDDKSVTGKIEIVKELSWQGVLSVVNSGKSNTGYRNSGDYNSGNHNSGYYNSGNYNSGDYNSGYRNSGDYNSGDHNSGNRNSGYYNSGNHNSGNRNSGYYNSGNRNSGYYNSGNYCNGLFCTQSPKIEVFNFKTDISMRDFVNDRKFADLRNVLYSYELPLTYWLYFDDMTEDEKQQYRQFECRGGVLLKRDYKTACQIWWKQIPEDEKLVLTEWEYFDKDVFFEITGIEIEEK